MAKEIDAAIAKKLKNVGITAEFEDDARAKLLRVLEKEGIEGMDEEFTETLIELIESVEFSNDVDDEVNNDKDPDEIIY